jgi:hypothetical protein
VRQSQDSGRGQRQGGELFRPDEARRVPWLEPEEDDEEEQVGSGLDAGRIFAVLIGGLAILAALAGAGWWLLGAQRDAAMVADGSIIEAPPGPYKVRPVNGGGTEVEGTGAAAFEVAEGGVVEGTIADAPAEAIDGAIGVQIGAFPSREEATAAWGRLGVRIPALAGRSHRILEGSADSGAVFRLQAVAGNAADAQALCAAIREDGGDCQVK